MDSELLKLRIPGIIYLIALLLEVVVSILVAMSLTKMARLHATSTNIMTMPNQSRPVRR